MHLKEKVENMEVMMADLQKRSELSHLGLEILGSVTPEFIHCAAQNAKEREYSLSEIFPWGPLVCSDTAVLQKVCPWSLTRPHRPPLALQRWRWVMFHSPVVQDLRRDGQAQRITLIMDNMKIKKHIDHTPSSGGRCTACWTTVLHLPSCLWSRGGTSPRSPTHTHLRTSTESAWKCRDTEGQKSGMIFSGGGARSTKKNW